MRTFLGLDLGTSATKAVVLAEDGTTIARAREPHPTSRRGRSGRADPSAWEQSILSVCHQLGSALATISGVGIDTHCPTVVPLDAHRRPVALAVTWDNPALGSVFGRYSELRSIEDVRRTGNRPSPSTFAVVAYHHLREAEPEAFARMTTLGFAGTWLGGVLTGEIAIDPTQASYSGIFDTLAATPAWLDGALADLAIDRAVLPPILRPLDVLGSSETEFARLAGIPHGVPVIVGCADTPAASFALGTAPNAAPFLIMGTTHVVSSCFTAPDLRSAALQRHGVRPGEWLINGVTNGGDSLAAAASVLGFGSAESGVKELIHSAASIAPDDAAEAPFFIPHLMPERGPLWLDVARSALVGLTASTTRQQLAWAIVEGVVLADRIVLESIVPPGDAPIYLTGPFGADALLPQVVADVTARTYDVVLEPDLPAMGAAAMCAASLHAPSTCRLATRRVAPRPVGAALAGKRWERFRGEWSRVTGADRFAAPTATRPSSTPADWGSTDSMGVVAV